MKDFKYIGNLSIESYNDDYEDDGGVFNNALP